MTAFTLVLSKTDPEFNGNQSDWKHFAEKRELFQTSHFIIMKKLSRKNVRE